MKYCEKCHLAYSDEAAACPRCGVSPEKAANAEIAEEKAERRRVGLDWLWLVVGIPLFIGLIYLLVWLLNKVF